MEPYEQYQEHLKPLHGFLVDAGAKQDEILILFDCTGAGLANARQLLASEIQNAPSLRDILDGPGFVTRFATVIARVRDDLKRVERSSARQGN